MRHRRPTKRNNKPRRLQLESLETRLALSVSGPTTDLSHDMQMGFARLEDRSSDPWDHSNDPAMDSLPGRWEAVFNLQSKPDSNFTIFLDYDGHVTENAAWNSGYGLDTIIHPPYDVDGDDSFFNSTELSRMETAWQRTAEDFAAFDVNVTTIDPGVDALIKSSDSDPEWGIRVVATRDSFADCGCGGHAYINSFNFNSDTAALVYNRGNGALGETISHEVGHALNLSHDGTSDATYYGGHGSGSTSWGAIMGAPFNEEITQWDQAAFTKSMLSAIPATGLLGTTAFAQQRATE